MSSELKGQRILAIIYGTELFGSERANLEALRALQSKGAEIHVAVSGRVHGGGAVGKRAREMGFSTFEMPFGSHFAASWMLNDKAYRKRQLKRIWTISRLLSQKIREIEPTVLMFSTVLSFMFCGLATLLNRVPIIYRIGDAPPVDSKFQMIFWKWLVRRANHVVCISDFIRKEVLVHSSKNPKRVSKIYNAPITREGKPNGQLIDSLRKTKRSIQFLFVGQITENKGVHYLVDALLSLNDAEVGCWIVGGSKHTTAFQQELNNRSVLAESKTTVEFLGFLQDPRPFYIAADWVVVPSRYDEPLGNIVQEAAQWKTPAIISNRGGLPELIRHNEDGIILQQPSSIEIARVIRWIQMNPEEFSQFGDNIFEKINNNFGLAEYETQWSEVVLAVTQ